MSNIITHLLWKRSAYSLLALVLAWGVLALGSPAGASEDKHVAKQVTVVSVEDPIPGHRQHQLGMLLPPQEGVIYSGMLTYTASKPVEVVVFHAYDSTVKPDGDHGDVLTGIINGKPYAISVMQFSNDVKATNSATVSFAGSGVALHTLNGDKFTATTTLDVKQHGGAR